MFLMAAIRIMVGIINRQIESILNSYSEYQRIRLSGDVITLITQWQVA